MPIDRIGKGSVPPVPTETPAVGGVKKTEGAGAVFSVDATKKADATEQTEAASAALAKFRAGEIDVHGYIDLKVEEATVGLNGLSAAELDDIRGMLRDRLRNDPELIDLVRAATGQAPTSDD